MSTPVEVMRLTAGTCWMCTAPALVRIDLCREHAREHARAVLRVVHDEGPGSATTARERALLAVNNQCLLGYEPPSAEEVLDAIEAEGLRVVDAKEHEAEREEIAILRARLRAIADYTTDGVVESMAREVHPRTGRPIVDALDNEGA